MNASGDGHGPRSRVAVSFVLVTYNSAHVVGDALESVMAHAPAAEVVVVDNGSEDHSPVVARHTAPGMKLIDGHGNVGFGRACNLGAAAATGNVLVFLNPDARISEFNLSRLESTYNAMEPFGLHAGYELGPAGDPTPLLDVDRRWVVELVRTLYRFFLRPRVVSRRAERRWTPRGRPLRASGAAMLVRRDEFLELGGFDERFFMYYEDHDLSRRYRAAGMPSKASSAMVVAHEVNGSSDVLPAQRVAWALLGLIQLSAVWGTTGRYSAPAVLHALRAIALACHVPAVGPLIHVRRKGQEARAARQAIIASSFTADSRYPDAERLVRQIASPQSPAHR
jgi:N-acetylglucosaminyl-diphospho-decaprenol L-rhamnosyltransferase